MWAGKAGNQFSKLNSWCRQTESKGLVKSKVMSLKNISFSFVDVRFNTRPVSGLHFKLSISELSESLEDILKEPGCEYTPVKPTLGTWRQEGQEFKSSLRNIRSAWPVWITWDSTEPSRPKNSKVMKLKICTSVKSTELFVFVGLLWTHGNKS